MRELILVTGGTGTLGRAVVRRLLDEGRRVRVMSRGPRPAGDRAGYEWVSADLRSGRGAADALAGVGAVVHCATDNRGGELRLLNTVLDAAARRSAPPHVVYISIVGIDRVPLGYYRQKLAAERLLEQSRLPYTILRATQFHELVRSLFAAAAKSPVMPVPAVRVQPVEVREVAARLAELAVAAPAGRVTDLAGPEVRDARELARAYLRATGRRRLILPVRLPGRTFRALAAGGLLAPEHADGRITFEQFLAG